MAGHEIFWSKEELTIANTAAEQIEKYYGLALFDWQVLKIVQVFEKIKKSKREKEDKKVGWFPGDCYD